MFLVHKQCTLGLLALAQGSFLYFTLLWDPSVSHWSGAGNHDALWSVRTELVFLQALCSCIPFILSGTLFLCSHWIWTVHFMIFFMAYSDGHGNMQRTCKSSVLSTSCFLSGCQTRCQWAIASKDHQHKEPCFHFLLKPYFLCTNVFLAWPCFFQTSSL